MECSSTHDKKIKTKLVRGGFWLSVLINKIRLEKLFEAVTDAAKKKLSYNRYKN